MLIFDDQKKNVMGKVAGVATKKNAKGEITHIAINMKKHGRALMPVFKSMGIIEQSQFDRECAQAISVEESRQSTLKEIRSWSWEK